ncbi:site-2 protease family protein [Mariniblastus fucicola]|uniref:Zinc metalloprotease n=1 Tax=Mariniblastus fucicola TaxID=980251 RepID=A0A5B9PD57_9BACT|nr:site-2 protease family protein [Mariniblastus fucicola]QEG20981.1 Putative zinc metalloprotease [Mariniblastus fucicola]
MDFSLIVLAADDVSYWLQLSTWWAIAQVVLGLGFVIFVHELGHFLVAKACGVKCEKFYVGFDVPIKIFGRQILPAALFRKQIGETEYGIGMVPFGGYVKMLGQDDNPGNIEREIQRSRGDDGQAESAGYVDRNELDPRSYRAKTVPQRMAIISAGVIFNLIFAILFAALAFKFGVDYDPASIGSVVGGGPAWEQNLAGSELTRVGDEPVKKDRYFTWGDMAQEIIFSADEGPVEFDLKRDGADEATTVAVTARKGMRRDMPDLPLLGLGPQMIAEVGSDDAIPGNPAMNASPPLKKGDVILEINGTKIDRVAMLRQQMYVNASEPVELLVERTTGEKESETKDQIKVSIDHNPAREIGFGIEWGTVAAIQTGSPADGVFEKGDEILSVVGLEDIGPLTFDFEMSRHLAEGGGELEFLIKRAGQETSVKVTPVPSKSMSSVGSIGVLAIDSIGIAVKVSDRVGNIDPTSKLAQSGIKSGDQIVKVTYLLSEADQKEKWFEKMHEKEVELEDTSFAEIFEMVQKLPAGTEFAIDFKSGETIKSVTIKSTKSDRHYLAMRGFSLTGLQWHYQSPTWSDAFSNGAKQVRNDASRVWRFLKKLVTGKLSVTNMGGPGMIAVAATSEASQGTSRLLLFLTLLSANLAIVNFLPIPVLDGGHMMFLAYEGLFRRPVTEKVEILLTYGGLFFILGLMIFVTVMDVGRISKFFF